MNEIYSYKVSPIKKAFKLDIHNKANNQDQECILFTDQMISVMKYIDNKINIYRGRIDDIVQFNGDPTDSFNYTIVLDVSKPGKSATVLVPFNTILEINPYDHTYEKATIEELESALTTDWYKGSNFDPRLEKL